MIKRISQQEYETSDTINVKRDLERERLYLGGLIGLYSDALRKGDFDLAYEIESEMNHVGRRFCELNMLQLKLSEGEN